MTVQGSTFTPGSGGTVLDDTVTIGGVSGKVQFVKLVDGTVDGTGLIAGDATNGLDVDVTRVVPGTGATHLGKAEDAVHATGDVGVGVLAVRRDTAAPGSGADGDYSTLNVDADGRLWVAPELPAARVTGTALASAARTVTTTSAQIDSRGARGVMIWLNVTVNPGAARTLQVTINAYDPVTATVLQFTAFTANTANNQICFVYPGADASGVQEGQGAWVSAVSLPLPRTFSITIAPSDATSWTYSVGYSLLP